MIENVMSCKVYQDYSCLQQLKISLVIARAFETVHAQILLPIKDAHSCAQVGLGISTLLIPRGRFFHDLTY